jgi:NADPH2:quinone reductase
VNPGDVKKRAGWTGSAMPYPRVTPHSDAVGVVDQIGSGVAADRRGERVWVHGAQSYRAFGTAAQYTVVPADLAVALPGHIPDELGACLGIPGITAHRAVFADGPVHGTTVLVHGVLGGVGSLAAQLAAWGGATVIGTVRRKSDLVLVDPTVVSLGVALDGEDPAREIRAHAPEGVGRIIEVSLSDNATLDSAVVAGGATIAAYATGAERTEIPFWPMLFSNVTLRLLGSDDFPAPARRQAVRELTAAASAGALSIEVGSRHPLAAIAEAHEQIETGARGRVLVDVP